MDARDWIELGVFLLGAIGGLVGIVRYIDAQISNIRLKISDRALDVDRQLSDKISIGEYNRRHEDMEARVRRVERRLDFRNGMDRYHSKEGDEYG